MKSFITIVGLLAIFTNVAVAQQKKALDKNKVKKDSCYRLEYDMNGNELRIPCTVKRVKNNKATNQISLSKKVDPATGFSTYYKTETDKNGVQVKKQVSLVREYDGSGNSTLFLEDTDAAGNKVLIPAKIK